VFSLGFGEPDEVIASSGQLCNGHAALCVDERCHCGHLVWADVDELASVVHHARQAPHTLQRLHSRHGFRCAQPKLSRKLLEHNKLASFDVLHKRCKQALRLGSELLCGCAARLDANLVAPLLKLGCFCCVSSRASSRTLFLGLVLA